MQSYSFATWITNIFVFTFSVNRLFNTGFLLQTSEWNHPRKVGAIGRIARYTCRRAVVLDGREYWKGGNGGTDEMRTGVIGMDLNRRGRRSMQRLRRFVCQGSVRSVRIGRSAGSVLLCACPRREALIHGLTMCAGWWMKWRGGTWKIPK